ncbi:MAG TPA: aspartate aminotransferase family protein, partial [Paenibacillus sp.]|nr:aspartate aminotransferase family protein [Paenibacillus sp.]
MRDNHELKREGDINFSSLRTEWMTQLSAVSIDRIEADERAYMRQSMSTPCLN